MECNALCHWFLALEGTIKANFIHWKDLYLQEFLEMNPIPLLVNNSISRFYKCSPGPHFTPWIFYNATPLVCQGSFENMTSRMKHMTPQVTCPLLGTVGLSHPSIWVHSAHDELKHKCKGERLHFILYSLLLPHISVHQICRVFPTLWFSHTS